MAWTYYCEDDGQTLMADSKEELAEVVMEHANEDHEMEMTYEQALQSVNQNARQAA